MSHNLTEAATDRRGIACALLSTIFSSLATVCIVGSLRHLPPLFVSGSASVAGALLLAASLRRSFPWKDVRSSWRMVTGVVLLRGLIGSVLFIIGLSLTTAMKAVFFTKIEPYFVLLWEYLLFKKTIGGSHLLLLTVHIAGAVALSAADGYQGLGEAQLGDILIILSMVVSGLSYVVGRQFVVRVGARAATVLTSGLGGGLVLLLSLLPETPDFAGVPPAGWLYLGGYILLFHVLSLTLWYEALRTVATWIVSALRALGPLFGAPAAYLLLNETLTWLQALGGLLVVITSFLIARPARSR